LLGWTDNELLNASAWTDGFTGWMDDLTDWAGWTDNLTGWTDGWTKDEDEDTRLETSGNDDMCSTYTKPLITLMYAHRCIFMVITCYFNPFTCFSSYITPLWPFLVEKILSSSAHHSPIA